MHQRCYNPACDVYYRYGGRGITVCARWHSIHNFLEDMGHPPEGMSIHRVDNDGNYEPGNCVWATQETQNGATGRTKYITWQGRTQSRKAWAEELNINPQRISDRLAKGWDVQRTLTTPCSTGYEEGRRRYMAEAKRLWSQKGREYSARSRNKRRVMQGLEPVPVDTPAPPPAPVCAATRRTRMRVTTEHLQTIERLHGKGLTIREIADELDMSPSTVHYSLKKLATAG